MYDSSSSNPGNSYLSGALHLWLAHHQIPNLNSLTNSGPSGVSTPFPSAPSLVSTLPNSTAEYAAPSDSYLQLNNDDSDLEGWIRSVAGMSRLNIDVSSLNL